MSSPAIVLSAMRTRSVSSMAPILPPHHLLKEGCVEMPNDTEELELGPEDGRFYVGLTPPRR